MSNLRSSRPRPARISSRVRAAVQARVRKGLSIAEAAKAAGLSRGGFDKALRRPAVQHLIRETQEGMVREVDHLRAVMRVRALEEARTILEGGSENAKLRVIEMLLREGKAQTEVSVHVDARQQGGGYEYPPRGARVVEIEPGKIPEA